MRIIMKKSIGKIIAITCCIIMLVGLMVSCDSTSGKANAIFMQSYRKDGQFELPIKVTRYHAGPITYRAFKSKNSLDEIFQILQKDTYYDCNIYNDYILIIDPSSQKLGYCLVKKLTDSKKFNYYITNMTYLLTPAEHETYNTSYGHIMVPAYLIDDLSAISDIKNNSQYTYSGSIENFVAFYEGNGFEVEKVDSTLIINEPLGKMQADKTYIMNEVAATFMLTFDNGKLTFQAVQA